MIDKSNSSREENILDISNNAISQPTYYTSSQLQKEHAQSDDYAKVNKQRKITDELKKSQFDPEGAQMRRREAVRKSPGDRRMTVASFDPENVEDAAARVSVAGRTKLFSGTSGDKVDNSKGEKPSPPAKPEAVKRHSSMRMSSEFQQERHRPEVTLRKDSAPVKPDVKLSTDSTEQSDNIYNPPWDLTKNPLVEKVKQAKPPMSSTLTRPLPAPNSSSTPKPPLPNNPPRKVERTISGGDGKEKVVLRKRTTSKSPSRTPGNGPPPAPTYAPPAPPPKPPRTHAHDSYFEAKFAINKSESSTESKIQIVENAKDNTNLDAEYLSVKERVSKMKSRDTSPHSSPTRPVTSYTPLKDLKEKDQSVAMRHPPSRPPPPRRRPSSGGAPPVPPPHRPQTEGPIVIPVRPRKAKAHAQLTHTTSDQVPYTPGQKHPYRHKLTHYTPGQKHQHMHIDTLTHSYHRLTLTNDCYDILCHAFVFVSLLLYNLKCCFHKFLCVIILLVT